MASNPIQDQIDDATLDFTLGDDEQALEKLLKIVAAAPDSFGGWHALTEVYYSLKDYGKALEAAEKAHALSPGDPHINTSLSRIWVELGDKAKAEHYNGQARMMSWKSELEGE